jgi:glycosyltransferase involved in cell wall biosynthesis
MNSRTRSPSLSPIEPPPSTLLLPYALTANVHAEKDSAPATHGIIGARVFATEVVRALLKYGSYDRYYMVRTSTAPAIEEAPEARLQLLDSRNIGVLTTLAQPVVGGRAPDYTSSSRLRHRCSRARDWPITSFIHAVESKFPPAWLLAMVLGDLQPWDALICSSTAHHRVLQNHLDALPAVYPSLTRLPSLPRMNLPIIPLGTDAIDDDPPRRDAVRRRFGLADDDVLLLYVGRFSPSSKCDLVPLLVAFANVTHAENGRVSPRLQLVLAGDDTRHRLAGGLQTLARELGCGEAVRIQENPTHDDKRDLYRAADVFISPSDNLQETFGLTLIEALAAGLPVIAADWNGYRDLIVHGESGFLVPTGWTDLGSRFDALYLCGNAIDGVLPGATAVDVGQLMVCIERLAQNPARRRSMGARGRREFETRFHWPVVIRAYEALWDELKAHARRDTGAAVAAAKSIRGDVRHTFGHYPSAQISDTCEVVLGPAATRLDTVLAASARLPIACIPAYEASARQIVNLARKTPVMTIEQLVAAVSAGDEARELPARLAVARLLKHGVLQVHTATGSFGR